MESEKEKVIYDVELYKILKSKSWEESEIQTFLKGLKNYNENKFQDLVTNDKLDSSVSKLENRLIIWLIAVFALYTGTIFGIMR